jgi:hypothetical protein
MASLRRAWHVLARAHKVSVLPYAAGYGHTMLPIPHMNSDCNPASPVEVRRASALPSVVMTLSSSFACSGTCSLSAAQALCTPLASVGSGGPTTRQHPSMQSVSMLALHAVCASAGCGIARSGLSAQLAIPLSGGGRPCLPCVIVYTSCCMSFRGTCVLVHSAGENTVGMAPIVY